MASVELVPVLLGYVALPERVEGRFRVYAAGLAVEEYSRFFAEAELNAIAKKAGRSIWTEEDILVASKLPDATWGGSKTGAELRQDIYYDVEHKKLLEEHIEDLQNRLASLTPSES